MKKITQKMLCLFLVGAMIFGLNCPGRRFPDRNDNGIQTLCIDDPQEILD